MWKIEGDEFIYKESVNIEGPIPLIFETIARADQYDSFLTDVAVAEMEAPDVCRMIYRAGPLRVEVKTKVTLEEYKRIEFEMIEGPALEFLKGRWDIEPIDKGAKVTLETHMKAGRAGKWLLKAASKYIDRKNNALIEAFRQQVQTNNRT